jgi:tetratricopeptide (TPR) repeat protein
MRIDVRRQASRFVLLPFAALLLSATALAAASQKPEQPPQTTDQDAEYAACLDMARKQPDVALERAKKWWDSGGNFGPRHCIAVALVTKESYVQAAKILEDLANDAQDEIAPLRADLYDQAGQAYYLAGMLEQAIPLYSRALATKPRDPDILIDRAVARDEHGQHFEAIDDLNLAIEIAPDKPEAWLYRANAYRHLNSLDLALADADQAIALSRTPAALLERATIKSLRHDETGARADLQAVVKLAPNSVQGKEAAKRLKAPGAKPQTPPAPPPRKPKS